MTTTDRPTKASTKPTYLTDVYEVVRDGRTYWCQQVEYMGQVLETCWDDRKSSEVFEEIFDASFLSPGDPGYDEVLEYLNQFLIPRDGLGAE